MIKTELDYNPYLNETKITFNGNKPRINSLVEKHLESKLQSWIKHVPKIFHDEMNGYDFDFLFSGTNLEFEELVRSFADANVSDEDVRLIHVNKLESRKQKEDRIEKLLLWFETNRNNRFDYDDFTLQNKELIKDAYRYVILHADLKNVPKLEEHQIDIECISNVLELENAELMKRKLLLIFPNHDITIVPLVSVISVHVGLDCIGVQAFKKF